MSLYKDILANKLLLPRLLSITVDISRGYKVVINIKLERTLFSVNFFLNIFSFLASDTILY